MKGVGVNYIRYTVLSARSQFNKIWKLTFLQVSWKDKNICIKLEIGKMLRLNKLLSIFTKKVKGSGENCMGWESQRQEIGEEDRKNTFGKIFLDIVKMEKSTILEKFGIQSLK